MQRPLQSQFHMSQQAIDDFGALIGKRVPALKRKPGTVIMPTRSGEERRFAGRSGFPHYYALSRTR